MSPTTPFQSRSPRIASLVELLATDIAHPALCTLRIDGLGQLQLLRRLNLSSNKLTKIENLSHLEKLESLQLQDNQVGLANSIDRLLSFIILVMFRVMMNTNIL